MYLFKFLRLCGADPLQSVGPAHRFRQTRSQTGNHYGRHCSICTVNSYFCDHVFSADPPAAKEGERTSGEVGAVRRGDQVVTQGGLIGKVTKVKEDNELEVEVADGVKVRVVQSTLADVRSKTEPANDA